MPNYRVINIQTIEAESALEATERAWKFLRNDGSIANHFTVQDEAGNIESVDLMEHYGDDGYDGRCPACADAIEEDDDEEADNA